MSDEELPPGVEFGPPLVTLLEDMCACKVGHALSDPTAGGKLCGRPTSSSHGQAKDDRGRNRYPTCHARAGWGTPNIGALNAACRKHGGTLQTFRATQVGYDPKDTRYGSLEHPRVKELYDNFIKDADPLNTLAEIALARALLRHFIERYDEMTEALLGWFASWRINHTAPAEEDIAAYEGVLEEYEILARTADDLTDRQAKLLAAAKDLINTLKSAPSHETKARPRVILDISDAVKHANTVTMMVERVENARAQNAISRADLFRVIEQIGRVLMQEIQDQELLKKIRKRLIDEVSIARK